MNKIYHAAAKHAVIIAVLLAALFEAAPQAARASGVMALQNPLPPGTYTTRNGRNFLQPGIPFLVGLGATGSKLPPVTINGTIKGNYQGVLQTNGADLTITSIEPVDVGAPQIIAANGSININGTGGPSNSNYMGILTIKEGMNVTSAKRLTITTNINMANNSRLDVNGDYLLIESTLNRNDGGGLQAGAHIYAAKNISFNSNPAQGGDVGINGASGIIEAGIDINQLGNNVIPEFDLKQGDGSLYLKAGRDITARIIEADNVEAKEGTITADSLSGGVKLQAGADMIVKNGIAGGDVTAGRDISAKTVKGGAVSAGRNITADSVVASSAHVGGSFVNVKTINATGAITGDNDVAALESIGGGSVEAKRDIYSKTLTGNSLKAGRNIVAGAPAGAGQISLQAADRAVSPNGVITASRISAPLVAAGEVKDKQGVAGRVETPRLLVVKNPGDPASSGDFTLYDSSFALTGTSPVGQAGYNADGSVFSRGEAAWIGGNMSVNNAGQSSFTTLGVGGTARIAGGSLSGGELNANSVALHGGIKAEIDKIRLGDSGSLRIGAASDGATLTTDAKIKSLVLNGGELQVGAGAGQALAAIGEFVVQGKGGALLDGPATVGHNGVLALGGSSATALQATARAAGLSESAAVVGAASPIILGAGLLADSGFSMPQARARSMGRASAGQIGFFGDSLLVIDGSKAGVNYADPPVKTAELPASVPGALSSALPATALVGDGAKIFIQNVTPGHTYVALGRNIKTVYEGDGWGGANLLSSNPLLGLERLGDGMEGQFSVREKASAAKVIAVTSGVPRMARTASETMEDAIYHRIRLGQEDRYRRNFALWALPIYESINHFGFDGGDSSYGYRGGIGGIALGGDYTWHDALRGGIAFNMGGGYARSTGDYETTRNNMDFWGAGIYGVWKPGDFSLDADMNFTSVYNKARQDLPDDYAGSQIRADIPAWSIGAGLRAQYEIVTDWITLRPHAGFRYFHLTTQAYDMTLNGQDVMRSERAHQNVWTFPFGIVFTRNFKLGDGYELTPLVNLKAVPASGDVYMKNTIRYAGAHKDIEFDTQVMDDITWGGRAGLEFRAGDLALGVNYTAQFGSHTSNQGVFGVLRYEF